MANKHEVLALYRKHRKWSPTDIAAELECHPAYVRATIARAGLPARHTDIASRTLGAQRRLLEGRERGLLAQLRNVRDDLERVRSMLQVERAA